MHEEFVPDGRRQGFVVLGGSRQYRRANLFDLVGAIGIHGGLEARDGLVHSGIGYFIGALPIFRLFVLRCIWRTGGEEPGRNRYLLLELLRAWRNDLPAHVLKIVLGRLVALGISAVEHSAI